MKEIQKLGLNNDHEMSQILSMFRKYLFSKPQRHHTGKTTIEESQVLWRSHDPSCPLLPSQYLGSRPPSSLELQLLPSFRKNAMQSQTEASPAQLTIFYAGAINVYDNVPPDKAQEIMQLAGGSCMPKSNAVELPNKEMKKQIRLSGLTSSACKLKAAEPPIARKLSLQHFPQKRRHRISSKSPYSHPKAHHYKEIESIIAKEDGSNAQSPLSLTPFPSKLGYSFPISIKKDR